MNELFKRTITGFIYVFLLLSAIMLNADAFDFLFLSFGIICLFEFKRLIRLKELHIFLLFFVGLVAVYSLKNLSFLGLYIAFGYFAYQYIPHDDAFQRKNAYPQAK